MANPYFVESTDPNAPATDVAGILHPLHNIDESGSLKSAHFIQQRTSDGKAMNLVQIELRRNGEVYDVMRVPVFVALKFHDTCKVMRGLKKSITMMPVMDDGRPVCVFDD